MIEAWLVGVFGNAEAAGGVALRVGIDDQNPDVVGGQRGGEVDGGRGFADAAFLVGDCEDSAQAFRLHAWVGLGSNRDTEPQLCFSSSRPGSFQRGLYPPRGFAVRTTPAFGAGLGFVELFQYV